MTENKSTRSGGSPFNLDALEKMDSKKTRGGRFSKPDDYQVAQSITKPPKKLDPLKHFNPWPQEPTAKSLKKPAVISKPDSQDASPKEKEPVKKAEAPPASARSSAKASTQDTASHKDDDAPAPVSKENTVLPKEDKRSRIVESVIKQADGDKEKEKIKRASKFTYETVKEIVSEKTAKKDSEKKVRVKVTPLGSVMADVISKSINSVIDTGKTVAQVAGSRAQAAVDIAETGVKTVSEAVKDAVTKPAKKPAKPSSDGVSEEVEEKSVLSDSAKTATAFTEKVADGVLAVGLGAGRMVEYVVRGAVAAPVDIARGASDLIVNTISRVAGLCCVEPKKKSGRKD